MMPFNDIMISPIPWSERATSCRTMPSAYSAINGGAPMPARGGLGGGTTPRAGRGPDDGPILQVRVASRAAPKANPTRRTQPNCIQPETRTCWRRRRPDSVAMFRGPTSWAMRRRRASPPGRRVSGEPYQPSGRTSHGIRVVRYSTGAGSRYPYGDSGLAWQAGTHDRAVNGEGGKGNLLRHEPGSVWYLLGRPWPFRPFARSAGAGTQMNGGGFRGGRHHAGADLWRAAGGRRPWKPRPPQIARPA